MTKYLVVTDSNDLLIGLNSDSSFDSLEDIAEVVNYEELSLASLTIFEVKEIKVEQKITLTKVSK